MSKPSTKQYVDGLVTKVIELAADGITDPSARQIAERYYGPNVLIRDAVVEDVRRQIGRIRAALHEDGYLSCPLSNTYYRVFRARKRMPQTRDEARRCVPTGSRPQVGLLLLSGNAEPDIIWQEWTGWRLNQGASAFGRQVRDVHTATTAGRLDLESSGRILAEGERAMGLLPALPIGPAAPEQPALPSAEDW